MTSEDDLRRLEAARVLLGPLLSGLPEATRLRALETVLGAAEKPPSLQEVSEWLSACGTAETGAAAQRLRALECEEALRCHELRRADKPLPERLARELAHLPLEAPLGWPSAGAPDRRVGEALCLLEDHFFVTGWPTALPAALALVQEALERTLQSVVNAADALSEPLVLLDGLLADPELPEPLKQALARTREALIERNATRRAEVSRRLAAGEMPAHGDPEIGLAREVVAERLAATHEPVERQRLLDWLLVSPDRQVVPLLAAACAEPWAQQRAMPVLSLRFGKRFGPDWPKWSAWLGEQGLTRDLGRLLEAGVDPGALLLLAASRPESPLADVATPLREWCRTRAAPVLAGHFLERWGERLPAQEARELAGLPAPEPAAPPQPATKIAVPPPAAPPAPAVPALPAPPVPERVVPEPAAPDPWRGFIAENANLLAGIAMLLVGASLVAYFTWNRHWLFRYTLVPALFGAFTAGLAGVARWLERNDSSLKGTAAMLRGAAILLLPANCMSVSLLADDPLVTPKLIAVPAMAALYVVLLSLGLRRWCGDVHASLRSTLAWGLIFLNALVLVPPLARGLASVTGLALVDVLMLGFYVGFFVVAEVLRRYVTTVLTPEVAREPHITWFTCSVLVLTYAQVFVWVHGWERQLPSAAVYGPLLVLSGGLVFYVERRFRLVLGSAGPMGEESFVGFTLILAGILAGFAHPGLRIVCLGLAGLLWLYQAAHRRHPIHTYLGLLLLVLSGASVALLDRFPRVFLPGLSLGLCIGLAAVAAAAGRLGAARIRQAALELQQAALVLTAVVAALTQWHFRSEPLYTAAVLAAVAAWLFGRALRRREQRDVFIGAMVAALALPYLGFADMQGRKLAGNTLVMGLACLSLLWLLAIRGTRSPVFLAMRSTVLFLYGAMAVTAMAARVLLERQFLPHPSWWVAFPEYVGPAAMLAVLVYTTCVSRSMLPMLGGLLMVIGLLPELKADLTARFPGIAWGTGYGSAVTSLLLLALAFHVRGMRRLEKLGEGDRFFGEAAFPLRRHDHTLITTPLIAAALFLTLRVDSYSLIKNLPAGPPLKTAAAVILSAASWTLLGVWARERTRGRVAVHLGFAFLLLGMLLGQRQWGEPSAIQWPLLATGLVLQAAEVAYRAFLVPRHPWIRDLLIEPTRAFLHVASAVAGIGVAVALALGHRPDTLRLLILFVVLQLVRAALGRGGIGEGSLAVAVGFLSLLAETAPGDGDLLSRLSWERSLWPALGFATAAQLVALALERERERFRRLAPLIDPARALAALLTLGLTLVALPSAVLEPRLLPSQQLVLIANLLLLARWALPGPSLLLAVSAAYVWALHSTLAAAPDAAARFRILIDPLHLALFALALALGVFAGRRRSSTPSRWLISPMAVPQLATALLVWLELPALLLAVLATARHSIEPALRAMPDQLAAPYLSAAALVLLAGSTASTLAGALAAAALTLANVHAVRLFGGDVLRGQGLSDVHLAALGVAATLIQCSIARSFTRPGPARDGLRQATLGSAALVLTLLSGNFVADPNLQDMTAFRLAVSGTMALAAGLYFRRAATRPEPDEARFTGVAYGIYHYGVAMALWCLVLLVPFFRHPSTALLGLTLPVAYFYLASENFLRAGDARAARWGRSTAVMAAAVLVLYVARPLFQVALFPGEIVRTAHYHYNAPLVVLMGLVLLRLHAIEQRFWLAYAGGTAVMAGVYFSLTSWPWLSPFETRFPAAWAAVVLAHAFALASHGDALRRVLRRFAAIDDAAWERLGVAWHLTAFVGALDVALLAAVHPDAARFGWGALSGAVASILLQRAWLRPAVASVTALLLTVGLAEAVAQPALLSEVGLLVVALFAARVAPGPFVLIGSLAVYFLGHHTALVAQSSVEERVALLMSPWRLAALSLGLALMVELERRHRGAPQRFGGPFLLWLGAPAATLALIAALRHAALGASHQEPLQLLTGYLASATYALLALSPGAAALAWPAAGLLALANVHVVRHYAGEALRTRGLSEAHAISLGIAVLLLLLASLRAIRWSDEAARRLLRIGAVASMAVLGLLVGNYAVYPGVLGFGAWRGVLSGAMALVAAFGLRQLARGPEPPRANAASEALYHLALAVAIWSFALAVPALRTPQLALLTASLPAVYLWARSEIGNSVGDRNGARYRDSAIAASALTLLAYASRRVTRAALLTDVAVTTRHHHAHAPVALALGLLLVRLHGLGAPYGVAVAGALSVMAGSYFAVTAWPGLSPYEAPLQGAWAAIALVHLWTIATSPSSSVTAVIRAFGGLQDEAWQRLRAAVGKTALLAAHLLALLAIGDPALGSHAIAPLLCGTASLLVHHGLIRKSGAYFDLAAIELLAALHADLIVPSPLPFEHVLWTMLAARAALVLASSLSLSSEVRARVDAWGSVCACLVVAHVLHHRPWSNAGLAATGLLALLSALVPRRSAVATTLAERLVVAALIATPTWLVLFGSARFEEAGLAALLETEPLLRTLITAFLTGVAAKSVPLWAGRIDIPAATPRAAHQVREYLSRSGDAVHAALLRATSVASVLLLAGHYGRPYSTVELVLFVALLAGAAVAWYRRGRSRGSWQECLVAELFAAATFGLLRRQLLLTTSFWTYEYDLWLSLAASALLTGWKQRLERLPGASEVKRPVTLSLLLMPALAIFWALSHGLGSNMVLLVVGLNSVLFALLGQDRRDSPYNLVAVSGFVAFVLIVFWSKLELRVLHAYVLPVGMGVLLLLQLFQDEVKPAARARIRLVTLALMLGSSAYHALLDQRYPVTFNLVLLALCLACMAAGSLMRIRLYVVLGLSVLLLDLGSLAVKALARMESQARMTWVGVAVFLLGAGIITIGVYHKARRGLVEARLARWRERLGGWE